MTDNTPKNSNEESNQKSTEANTNNSGDSSLKEILFIALGVISVVLFWLFYPTLLNRLDGPQLEQPQMVIPYQIDAMLKTEPEPSAPTEDEKTKLQHVGDLYGTYGDSYGSLNTLFSGLAFAFLVASLFLQRKELQAQRTELEEQRKEIQESNKIAEGQRKITEQQAALIQDQILEAKKQNFYNLFFQFLDEKNIKFQNLKIRSRNPREFPDLQADIYVSRFAVSLLEAIQKHKIPLPPPDDGTIPTELEEIKIRLEDYYTSTCDRYKVSFEESFYFEYFVFLLKFIDQNSFVQNTDVIIETFLSRLTFDETICMACYAVLRNKELKDYIERYSLLKNIRPPLLADDQMDNLKLLFSEDAFVTNYKSISRSIESIATKLSTSNY